MARTKYSDADKAAALAVLDANGGNVNGAAKELGIAESTLRSWNNDRGVHPSVAGMRETKRADLADRIETIAHQILDVMPDKMKEATLKELSISFGIAMDKLLLLRGESTSNTRQEIRIVTDDDDGQTFN